MPDILLTINVMASNRLETTEKCFQSLAKLRKEVSCELIVTDTGCEPAMRKMVESYADRVIDFAWCNDFAKARQVSVDAACGVYYLYLDDDEWFIDTEAIIDFFKKGSYKKPSYVTYIQRNYHDFEGETYSDAWVGRMIYLTPETHFEDKIHEHLEPIENLSIVALSSIVEHYGYINTSKEAERAHYERNVTLLLEMIAEQPEKTRGWVHLAQEYKGASEWEKLYECGKSGMKLFEGGKNQEVLGDLTTFYASQYMSLYELGRYQEAIELANEAIADTRIEEFGRAHASLYQAQAQMAIGEYATALELISKYFSYKDMMSKNEVGSYLQSIAIFAGKAFDLENVQKAYSVELLCKLKLNIFGDLYSYIHRLDWDKSSLYIYPNILDEMVACFARDNEIPEMAKEDFGQFLKGLFDNKLIWEHITQLVRLYETTEGYDAIPILKRLATIQAEDWLISYARMQTIDGHKLEPYFLQMPMEEWMRQLSDHADYCGWLSIANLKDYFEQIKSRDDVRYIYLELYLKELTIIYGMNERDLENQRSLMLEYAELLLAFHQMFAEVELGERVTAAGCLKGAFEAESIEEEYQALRDAVVAYPMFAETIRKYIARIQFEQKETLRKQRDEMEQLKKQLLENAQMLIEQGDVGSAKQILAQLKTMMPEDLDVATLCLKASL